MGRTNIVDAILVSCCDPRMTHPRSETTVRDLLHGLLTRAELACPEEPRWLRLDVLSSMNPVHMAAEALQGIAGTYHLDWLYFQLCQLMALHQSSGNNPEIIILTTHAGCDAVGARTIHAEAAIIERDFKLVMEWFTDRYQREYPETPLPTLVPAVFLMEGALGKKKSQVKHLMRLEVFLESFPPFECSPQQPSSAGSHART